MTAASWFLLARRPGWRASPLLTHGVSTDDGALRLADLPRPGLLDCPHPDVLDLPGCRRAVVDPAGRRVLLLAGTGQVRSVLGPIRYEAPAPGPEGAAPAGPGTVHPALPAWAVPATGCEVERRWPPGTWAPSGLVRLRGRRRGRLAVVDATHRLVHVFDGRGRWCGVSDGADLDGCPIPEGAPSVVTEGEAVTVALDSGRPGCRWHRVVLTGEVPHGTHVAVAVLVTDADLGAGEVAGLDPGRWVPLGVFGEPDLASWDAAVTGPAGRYLWLRLTLRGDGTRSPRIDDVEVHFPRSTSLRHLPAVYAAGESDFLDRYLALTDTVRDSVTALLASVPRELDARSADADPRRDFLAWLGSWVGMTGTGALPEANRRRLVAEAAELYRRRGTPDGVARHVGLWLGRRTAVLEHYRLRRWAVLDHGRLGEATRLFGPEVVRRLQLDEFASIGAFRLVGTPSPRTDPFAVYAHRYTLFVYARPRDDVENLAATAARVAGAVQPAHTVSSVAVVEPVARVAVQATLGLDAVVAGPLRAGRLGDRLGIPLAGDPRRGGLPSIGIDARVGTRAALG